MATKGALFGILGVLLILSLLPGAQAIDITLVSPPDATTILKASTIDLTIAGGGTVNVTYTIDAAVTNISLASPWDIIANWTKGLNTLTVYAINGSENSEDTFQFTVNNSAPVVNSVDPVNNTVLATTVNLTAAVQDLDGISDVGDVKFYYSLANESVWTLINTETIHNSSTFSTIWNLSAVNDSTYKIKAVANDSEITGEAESAANITINNVNQNPVVDLTSLTGGQVIADEQFITWTATDPDGENLDGKISIYYATDNSTWTLIAGSQVNDGTYAWDTDSVSNGATYRLNITATDNFGGYGNDISGGTFTVNNQAGGGSSSSSDDSSSGEVSAGGNAPATAFDVSQIYQELVPGTKELNINVADLAIKKLTFTVSEGEIDARIKIRDIETLPTSISVEPAGTYQLFEVEATNLDSLTSATFEFEIPKAWLTSNNIDVSDIVVKRYTTSWTNILTTYIGENGNNYKFTAVTPGFSIFAITGNGLSEGGDVIAQATSEAAENSGAGGLLSGFAIGTFSLSNLNLPELSSIPGGWMTIFGIIIAVAAISVFAASKQGWITLPTADDLPRPREHAARLRTRMKNNRHAPTKKFRLPEFEFPQLEMPDFMGNKKQNKLKFGKDGWKKYK